MSIEFEYIFRDYQFFIKLNVESLLLYLVSEMHIRICMYLIVMHQKYNKYVNINNVFIEKIWKIEK